jgi:hypothetical protein
MGSSVPGFDTAYLLARAVSEREWRSLMLRWALPFTDDPHGKPARLAYMYGAAAWRESPPYTDDPHGK